MSQPRGEYHAHDVTLSIKSMHSKYVKRDRRDNKGRERKRALDMRHRRCRHFFQLISLRPRCSLSLSLSLSQFNKAGEQEREILPLSHLDPRRRGMGPALQPGEEHRRLRQAFDDGAKSSTTADDAVAAAPHRRPGRRGEAPEQRSRCATGRHVAFAAVLKRAKSGTEKQRRQCC